MMAATANSTFSHLPDVTFVERDTGQIEAAMVRLYEEVTRKPLYPGDPERLFIYTLAAIIAQRNVEQDYIGKQNLVRYAEGAYLDHHGALLDVPRLEASCASASFEWTLTESLRTAVVIPQGVRMTADSSLFWANDATLVISAGQMSVTGPGTALTPGTVGNGLVPGQVAILVDPLDGIQISVRNITTTAGGAEVENDESYRARIHLAPEKFSTAGPGLGYVYWALTAHPSIADVAVHSPAPGVVHVYVLLSGGVVPEADGPEIQAVREILADDMRRPLTDHVEIFPAEAVNVDYQVPFYLNADQAGYIKELTDGVTSAVDEYEAWQTGKIGRDLNPDELVRKCREAGAKRIETAMTFTVLAPNQVVRFVENSNRIVFMGVEEE